MTGVKLAIRALSRSPIVSLVVILSLGLGIGANTAIFSLMYQVLIRSLPVKDPQSIVFLNTPPDVKGGRSSSNNSGGMEAIFSYKMFRELEKDPRGLEGLAAFRLLGANLAYKGKTESGSLMLTSGNYFRMLGVQPLRGRLVEADDDRGAGNPVVVLGYGYWLDKLGGDPNVLNQPLKVNGQLFTVVGITPKGFNGTTLGDTPDVHLPLLFKPAMTPGWNGTDTWDDYYLYLFGRLSPGSSVQQAQDRLNGLYAGLVELQASEMKNQMPASRRQKFLEHRLKLVEGSGGQSSMKVEMKDPLRVLMACTLLVLVIASANAANLLLARSTQRGRELAIRTALGAGRGAIMRQLLTEALLLSIVGGLVGVLMGIWSLDALLSMASDTRGSNESLAAQLDLPVLLYALAVSVCTGLLFGLYPAWAAARSSVASTMKEQSGQSTATGSGVRVRQALVMAQVALSMLLLVPMGLFLKSLINLVNEDLGMRTENVLTFGVSPELNGYKRETIGAFFQRAEEELAAVPGVKSVTASMVPLIAGNNWGTDLTVEGYRNDPDADTNARFSRLGPGFFGKMGIPLLKGREFTDADTLASPKVAVVNETFAKHFFGDKDPVGRRFSEDGRGSKNLDTEIVGVIRDAKYSGVKQKPPVLFYTPYRQQREIGSIYFYVSTAVPVDRMMQQLRKAMARLDPDLPLEDFRTLDAQVQLNIRSDRMVLELAAAFAVLATALAMLGLYGVMAYGVSRRTREIGIRMALGAGLGRIRGLVMREVLLILVVGLVLGIPAALGVSRLAEALLFGVKSFDLLVVGAATAALTAASLVAGYLPAWRASRVNPIDALRYE